MVSIAISICIDSVHFKESRTIAVLGLRAVYAVVAA